MSPIDKLAAGKLAIEDLVRACPERGRRQVAVLLRKANLRGSHRVRYMTEYQLDRLMAVMDGKPQPPWPQEATPNLHQ